MELYVIRHAEAVPLGEGGVTSDELRPLTEKGKEQARRLGCGFRAKGIHLGRILTSPLLRARQTAEALLAQWPQPAPQLRICEALAPGCKRRKLTRFIQAAGNDPLALVGHQPDLGRYAAWLMGSKKAQLELAKAGVAYLVCDPGLAKGSGRLVWLVTPEWIAPSA